MLRYILSLCLILGFTNYYLKADPPPPTAFGSVSGIIIDDNGDPLPGATVIFEHRAIGAYAKNEGKFFIKSAPVGKYVMVASMVGYDEDRKEVTIKSGDTVFVEFELSEGFLQTGTVVVTGTSTPHLIEDAPVRTEVINAATIEEKKALNLAEALEGQPGLQVENNCNNCNFAQVRINGLDGKYSEILIDGDPVFSSLAGVYGLEQIPDEMIGQIEIVKGGGSALYGGGAVAGIVNIITRRPLTNRFVANWQTQIMTGKNDDPRAPNFDGERISDNSVGAFAEMVNPAGNAGAYLFASSRRRNPYDRNGDGFSELGLIDSKSIGFNSFYKPCEDFDINAGFHRLSETRRGGDDFSVPPHEADIAEAAETERWGGKIDVEHRLTPYVVYNAYYSVAITDRNTYYGGVAGDRSEEGILAALDAYGTTSNPLHLAGAKTNLEFDAQIITTGFDFKTENIVDGSVRNIQYKIDETYTNFGVFAQDNIHLLDGDALEIVAGARADFHSELENPFVSPRLAIKYALDYGFNLRASVGRGFKAPQVFDEDLHIESLGGKQRVIRNAPGLEPEKSWSFSVGTDYSSACVGLPLAFSANAFYTELTDAFDMEYSEEAEKYVFYSRINAGGATVAGAEASVSVRPTRDLELRAGANYKSAEYDEANPDYGDQTGATKFERTPDFSANFDAEYGITNDFKARVSVKYLGKAYVPHETEIDPETEIIPLVESDAFATVDVGVDYDFSFMDWTEVCLAAGVKNLLDEYQSDLDFGVDRDTAYLYGPALPRTFYAKITIEI